MDETVLNELLECSVCLERLDANSKVLPCQHTFCRRCLEEIVSTKQELRCPECRFLVETPIEELPMNILLIRLLEGMKTAAAFGSPFGVKTGAASSGGDRGNAVRAPAYNNLRTSADSKSTSQPCAKALYNYDAKELGDLSFKKGDVVLLRKQVDENWFHGELAGRHGFFPATYVQVLTPLPLDAPKCKALYDFVISDKDEKDCLTFQKDEVLSVIRRVDDNWVEGKLGDRIGIFPMSFVDLNESAKWLINSQANSAPSSSQTRSTSTETVLPSSSTAASVVSSSSNVTSSSTVTSLAVVSPDVQAVQRAAASQKRNSLTAVAGQRSSSSQQQQHRHSAELVVTAPIVSATLASAKPAGSASAGGDSATSPAVPGLPVTIPLSLYVALYNYKPQKDDEIELKKGDCYTVTERCQDGWFKGSCLKTGTTGVFPGNYVQGIRAIPAAKLTSRSANSAAASNNLGAASVQPSLPSPRRSQSSGSPGTSSASASRTSAKLAKPQHSGTDSEDSGAQSGAEVGAGASAAAGARAVAGATAKPRYSGAKLQPVGTDTSLVASAVSRSSERSHISVTRAHSFPKTSPLASKVNDPAKDGATGSHKPPATVTQTRTITNVTQAQTRSILSAPQSHTRSQPQTVSQAKLARSQSSAAKDRTSSSSSSHSPSSSRRSERERSRHGHHSVSGQSSQGHQSVTPSARVTSPNIVLGASGITSSTAGATGGKDITESSKEKKERKRDDKLTSMMKRLTIGGIPTKVKKSKAVPSPETTEGSAPPLHKRSGSLPSQSHSSSRSSTPTTATTTTTTAGTTTSTPTTSGATAAAAVVPPFPSHAHRKSHSLDSSQQLSSGSKPSKAKPLVRERYRCISPYPPQSEVELELKVGDIVYVYKKREDGWFKGTLQRTGKSGMFPSIFVEQV